MKTIAVRVIFILMCSMVAMVQPLDAEPMDGPTLAQRVYDREVGEDAQATVQMLLIDKRGNKRFRTMVTYRKDYGRTSKSYTRFTSPADIDGTAFLTWENEDRDDDQFLYLPALKRVRRIVSSQKSNRFVNTDYTYEEFDSRKPEEDTHRLLGSEKFMERDCWMIESVPKDLKNTQYGKRVSWIVKDIDLIVRTEYYDKRGRQIKEFIARSIKKIDGIWTAIETDMRDLKRRHRTLMRTTDIKFNRGVSDRVFTRGYMKHK